MMAALSIKFFNSLILPGQTYSFKAVRAESSKEGDFDPFSLISFKMCVTNIGISSFLSANVGISIGNTFIL